MPGPAPGVLRFNIYCDESGTGGALHYGFGSLWVPTQRRGDFVARFRDIVDAHRVHEGEVKWQKVKARTVDMYRELVDWFFRDSSLAFHCIVVAVSDVQRDHHGGDPDLARRKHFTHFLANKLKACMRAQHGREVDFAIYVDPIASRYAKADEAVHVIANRMVNQELELPADAPVRFVRTVDSKVQPGVQLCDLPLGATMDAWNRGSKSAAKQELRRHVASYLDWEDLDSDTFPTERKFNVWRFWDPRSRRARTPTRPVRLVHPLPRRKVYRP